MIVLDTNVLSEALKPSPGQAVVRWLARQDRELVYTTAITQAEILYGVETLPDRRRRTRLYSAVERLFLDEFRGRILRSTLNPHSSIQRSLRVARAAYFTIRRGYRVGVPRAACGGSDSKYE
jgi:predicted nucleic acid-binding protein